MKLTVGQIRKAILRMPDSAYVEIEMRDSISEPCGRETMAPGAVSVKKTKNLLGRPILEIEAINDPCDCY